jgi:VWFA-related protein
MHESKLTRLLAVTVLVALTVGPGPFQDARAWGQAPPTAPEVPVFGSQTAAVVVDVVVRDKKGKLVRDLTAADFTVLEDGAPQAVESLRVVDTAPAAEEAVAGPVSSAPAQPAGTGAAAPPAKAERTGAPSVIAFVFDRLSPNARKTAEKAALSYADRGYVEGDLVAVFAIDLALHTLQPFTNDVKARPWAVPTTRSAACRDPATRPPRRWSRLSRPSTRSSSTCSAPSTRSSATSRATRRRTAFWPW